MASILGNIYSSIVGGHGGGTSAVNNATSATSIPTQLNITPGGTTTMLGGMYAPPPPMLQDISDVNLSRLEGYVEMCGDTLEYIRVSKNIETKDPKISILKLASDGEFIKNVGLKYNKNTYYIIREKE